MKKPFKQFNKSTNKLVNLARVIVYLMGLGVFLICGLLFPELMREEAISNPQASSPVLFLLAAWVMAVPIFIALYQTLKLLHYVETRKAFTAEAVEALSTIKYCALGFITLVILGAITMRVLAIVYAPQEDTAPVFAIGIFLTFVTSIIATFVAVVENLLRKVLVMKQENDLTI